MDPGGLEGVGGGLGGVLELVGQDAEILPVPRLQGEEAEVDHGALVAEPVHRAGKCVEQAVVAADVGNAGVEDGEPRVEAGTGLPLGVHQPPDGGDDALLELAGRRGDRAVGHAGPALDEEVGVLADRPKLRLDSEGAQRPGVQDVELLDVAHGELRLDALKRLDLHAPAKLQALRQLDGIATRRCGDGEEVCRRRGNRGRRRCVYGGWGRRGRACRCEGRRRRQGRGLGGAGRRRRRGCQLGSGDGRRGRGGSRWRRSRRGAVARR